MPFKKGKSGNPKGRPKKQNSLSNILAQFGEIEIENIGKRNEIISEILWSLVSTGKAKLGAKELEISYTGEWLTLVKFIFDRIDGKPAPMEIDYASSSRKKSEIESVNDILPIIAQAINDTQGLPNNLNKNSTISKLALSAIKAFEVIELEERLSAVEKQLEK